MNQPFVFSCCTANKSYVIPGIGIIQTIAEECKLQEDECNRIVEQATQHMKELEQLKKGSLVNLGQITTISKQRISNPKMVSDSLYKIKLCAEDLEIINQKLKKLYIHE